MKIIVINHKLSPLSILIILVEKCSSTEFLNEIWAFSFVTYQYCYWYYRRVLWCHSIVSHLLQTNCQIWWDFKLPLFKPVYFKWNIQEKVWCGSKPLAFSTQLKAAQQWRSCRGGGDHPPFSSSWHWKSIHFLVWRLTQKNFFWTENLRFRKFLPPWKVSPPLKFS